MKQLKNINGYFVFILKMELLNYHMEELFIQKEYLKNAKNIFTIYVVKKFYQRLQF